MLDKQSEKTDSVYMYNTAADEIEAQRLNGLNKLHNPHTLKFLRPYLVGSKKILEIGCGSGNLAVEVMQEADFSARYIGVDRDPAQIKRAAESLRAYSTRTKVLQLDVINELDRLKGMGPFDLIYCRWLLVHLPKELLSSILRKIIGLLSVTGVFICDECDNRNVQFRPINNISISPYQEATNLWLKLSQSLMHELGNDLELTAEKIKRHLADASNGVGSTRIEGQYQVTLRTKNEKRLISDGYRSSSSVILKAYKKPVEEIIVPFDKCAEDDDIEVSFLTQNVVTYQKPGLIKSKL